jgi:hypothetical protein
MDPFARGAIVMANNVGGAAAEYRIRGEGPPVILRLVLPQGGRGAERRHHHGNRGPRAG